MQRNEIVTNFRQPWKIKGPRPKWAAFVCRAHLVLFPFCLCPTLSVWVLVVERMYHKYPALGSVSWG